MQWDVTQHICSYAIAWSLIIITLHNVPWLARVILRNPQISWTFLFYVAELLDTKKMTWPVCRWEIDAKGQRWNTRNAWMLSYMLDVLFLATNSNHPVEVSGVCVCLDWNAQFSCQLMQMISKEQEDAWKKAQLQRFIVCCTFILFLGSNASVCLQPVLRCKSVPRCLL